MNKPIPEDLVPILAKDEVKQRQIREKSTQDAQSGKARAIGVSASVLSATAAQKATAGSSSAKPGDSSRKTTLQPTSTLKPADRVPTSKSSNAVQGNAAGRGLSAAKANGGTSKMESSKTMPRISMVIQSIPPFRGQKKQSSADGKSSPAVSFSQPLSPTSQQRLNVNASSFRPNPKAVAFTPVSLNPPSKRS